MTRLNCPHCQALLTLSEDVAAGRATQCTHCRAPFTVSPADRVRGNSPAEECEVQAILVPCSAAAEPTPVAAAETPRNGILEHNKRRRERPGALMSAPYLPPPTPKEALQSSPFIAPARKESRGTLLAIICGLIVIAGGGSWLVSYYLDQPDVETNVAAHQPPPPVTPEIAAPAEKVAVIPLTPPVPNEVASEPAKSPPQVARVTPTPEPKPFRPRPSQPPPIDVDPVVPPKRPAAAPASKAWVALREAEQKRVDAAIERGVRYLKSRQLAGGSWMPGTHSVGYAALDGLTLLECGVPGNDPVIKKAAAFVRTYSTNLEQTYDLALAILFLDRLGDRKDQGMIQRLALRLVAGQSNSGGWTYECPILTPAENTELFMFLRRTRPEAAKLLNPLAPPRNAKLKDPLARANPALIDPFQKGKRDDFRNPVAGNSSPSLQDPLSGSRKGPGKNEPELIQPVDDPKQKNIAAGELPIPGDAKNPLPKAAPGKNPAVKTKSPPLRLDQLSPRIRNIRVVQENFLKDKAPGFFGSRDDNSNSQFAMLALWTARRHEVPTEKVLGLSFRRYQLSQNNEGGWNYQFGGRHTMAAMTGVGLLGLAMGHATSEEGLRAAAHGMAKNAAPAPVLRDPAIHKGLAAFGKSIGEPEPNAPRPAMANLYFLWTVERVAMLYNLGTIANKDWYRWGVYILLPNQLADGSWFSGQYPGSDMIVDTCFALLFLKRSNLVQDLTENLNLYLAIMDSDSVRSKNR